jgi:hypothetical protein
MKNKKGQIFKLEFVGPFHSRLLDTVRDRSLQ